MREEGYYWVKLKVSNDPEVALYAGESWYLTGDAIGKISEEVTVLSSKLPGPDVSWKRDDGYYWVSYNGAEPEVAEWRGTAWRTTWANEDTEDADMRVISERLTPPERGKNE